MYTLLMLDHVQVDFDISFSGNRCMYNCISCSHWNIPFELEKTINCL